MEDLRERVWMFWQGAGVPGDRYPFLRGNTPAGADCGVSAVISYDNTLTRI